MFGGLKKHHPPVADCVLGNLTIYAIYVAFLFLLNQPVLFTFFFLSLFQMLNRRPAVGLAAFGSDAALTQSQISEEMLDFQIPLSYLAPPYH